MCDTTEEQHRLLAQLGAILAAPPYVQATWWEGLTPAERADLLAWADGATAHLHAETHALLAALAQQADRQMATLAASLVAALAPS